MEKEKVIDSVNEEETATELNSSTENNQNSEDNNELPKHTLLHPNPEILRYSTNKLSFWLVILAIILNCLAFLDYYGKRNVKPDMVLGVDVIINILVLLACFVTAEEVKAYRKRFAYVSFLLAVVQIARIFFIPLRYYKVLMEYNSFVYIVMLYVLGAVFLTLAGLICIFRSNILVNYLNSIKDEPAESKGEVE